LAVPFLLTACGGKKGGGGSPAAQPPAPKEEPAPAPPTTASTATATEDEKPAKDDKDDDDEQDPPKTTDVFKPKHTPASFSLGMPGALGISLGGELRLQDEDEAEPISAEAYEQEQFPDAEEVPELGAPDQAESHGLAELNYQIESIENHIEQYSRELSTLDVVLEANADNCFDADGCDLQDAKGVFTQEMANKVVEDLGGAATMHPDEITEIDALVGGEIELGTITVRPSEDTNYSWVITVDDGAGRKLIASWLKDEVDGETVYPNVSLVEQSAGSWVDDSEEGGGAVHTYSVDYKVQFNAGEGSMQVSDESEYDGYKYNNSFYFLADADSSADGASFAVDISTEGPEGDGSFTKISGYADNGGAYLQTLYAFDDVTNTLTLSAAPAAWTNYDIFPAGTAASELSMENAWELSLGSFMVAAGEESTTVANVYYMGPANDDFPEAGLPLISSSFDEQTGEPSYADAGITVTDVTQVATRHVAGYTETFGVVDGQIDGNVEFCFYDFASTTLEWPEDPGAAAHCTGGWESAVGIGYADSFESEVGSDGLAKIGQVQLGIGGPVGWLDVKGAELYFISADDPDAAVTAINAAWASADAEDDADVWSKIVGTGTFVGLDGYDYSGVSINDYYVYSPWGSAAVLNAAKVAKLVFDSETGAATLQLLAYAEIVAVEITEENAGTSIEDVIANEAPIPTETPADCDLATELYDLDDAVCRAPAGGEEAELTTCSAEPGMILLEEAGALTCAPL
jgi:hypothetical protein